MNWFTGPNWCEHRVACSTWESAKRYTILLVSLVIGSVSFNLLATLDDNKLFPPILISEFRLLLIFRTMLEFAAFVVVRLQSSFLIEVKREIG